MHSTTQHRSRLHLLTLVSVLLMVAAGSAGATPGTPGADLIAKGAQPLSKVELVTTPAVDHASLLAEDALNAGPGVPLRFAQRLDVFYTPQTHGTWEMLPNGTPVWRLRVRSPGALSLSFAFTRYYMPPGGMMILYSPDGSMVQGPFTARDNKAKGDLWTPIVLGDEAVIELRPPAGSRPELELTQIFHGYRGLDGSAPGEKSGSCNVDVACPDSDGWDPQVRSVARITINGFSLCSGFLVNNVNEDRRPLFMTADHCGLSPASDSTLVVYWNFENSTCRPVGSAGGPGNGNLNQNQSGSTYLAGSPISDFTIVELDAAPAQSADVHWVGWDARDGDFNSAVTVHHPMGEEKRISFEDDPTETKSYLCPDPPGFNNCFGAENDGTHIRTFDWDVGTTEGGSSGSPLFSPEGRAVGQLHGGYAACGNNLPDWWGRISHSWGLGLSDHLDPDDTGTLVLDGIDRAGGPPPPPPPNGGACVADDNTLCLNGGRFRVTVDWKNFVDEVGQASVVPFGSDDSGLLWFFDPDNWEMLVKVLDGCAFNDHFWVFAAATTNVEYTLTVTDTENEDLEPWTFTNALGQAAPAVTDIEAFATCP